MAAITSQAERLMRMASLPLEDIGPRANENGGYKDLPDLSPRGESRANKSIKNRPNISHVYEVGNFEAAIKFNLFQYNSKIKLGISAGLEISTSSEAEKRCSRHSSLHLE